MCLAIFKSAEGTVTEEQLRNGFFNNDDGAGFAYVAEGKVVISKGFRDVDKFLTAYKEAEERNPDSPFLIHFRICSLGAVNEENTHPFPIDGGALVHNGTLYGTDAEYGKGPSDTSLFSKQFTKYLTYDRVQKYKHSWEETLYGNKIAILYDDGRHQIVNEKDGHWLNGAWFSNYSHRISPTMTTSPYAGMGMGAYDDDYDWNDYGHRYLPGGPYTNTRN